MMGDSLGYLYLADLNRLRIVRVEIDSGSSSSSSSSSSSRRLASHTPRRDRHAQSVGTVIRVAGTEFPGESAVAGPATSSPLHGPYSVYVETTGIIYFTDEITLNMLSFAPTALPTTAPTLLPTTAPTTTAVSSTGSPTVTAVPSFAPSVYPTRATDNYLIISEDRPLSMTGYGWTVWETPTSHQDKSVMFMFMM